MAFRLRGKEGVAVAVGGLTSGIGPGTLDEPFPEAATRCSPRSPRATKAA